MDFCKLNFFVRASPKIRVTWAEPYLKVRRLSWSNLKSGKEKSVAIEELVKERCTGCGICFSACPQDVFRMDSRTGKALIEYPEDCVACWSCEMFCPVHCIKVSEARPLKLPAAY